MARPLIKKRQIEDFQNNLVTVIDLGIIEYPSYGGNPNLFYEYLQGILATTINQLNPPLEVSDSENVIFEVQFQQEEGGGPS